MTLAATIPDAPTRCAGLCTDAGFAAAYTAHRGPLVARARARLDDPQLAEDVVQEVFVRAWAACRTFDPASGPPMRAWLATILRNVVIDMARAGAVRPRPPVPDPDSVPEPVDPDDAIERAALRIALLDGLAAVSAAHRGVVLDVVLRDRPQQRGRRRARGAGRHRPQPRLQRPPRPAPRTHRAPVRPEDTMKLVAPIITIAAVAALGAGLMVVNVVNTPVADTAVAAVSAPAAAPTTPPPPPDPAAAPAVAEKVYAGRSSGNEVTVAVAVKDGKAVAYLCDGKKVEAWLEGTLTGDELALTGPGGASLDGTVDEDGAAGTVAAGGKSWPYKAKAVQAPEGLYAGRSDVRGVTNRIGWIVVDGTTTGLRRQGDAVVPAPPLDPANPGGVVVDGQPFPVTTLTGAADVVGAP